MNKQQASMLAHRIVRVVQAEIDFRDLPRFDAAQYCEGLIADLVKTLLEIFPETPQYEPQAQDSPAQTGCIPKGSYEVNRGALHLRASEFMEQMNRYTRIRPDYRALVYNALRGLLEKTAREAFSEGYKARLTDGVPDGK